MGRLKSPGQLQGALSQLSFVSVFKGKSPQEQESIQKSPISKHLKHLLCGDCLTCIFKFHGIKNANFLYILMDWVMWLKAPTYMIVI